MTPPRGPLSSEPPPCDALAAAPHDLRADPALLQYHPLRNALTNVVGTRRRTDVHLLDETLGAPDRTMSPKRLREEGRRWLNALPQDRYPTLVRLGAALVAAPAERRFRLGLRALLDGLEQRLHAKRRTRDCSPSASTVPSTGPTSPP